MDALWVEPLVAQHLQVAILFHTGVFVVDGVDEFLVIAHDTDFAFRDIDGVDDECV